MMKIKVKGMSCQHCVNAVKKALSQIEGIGDVEVDLSRGEVSIEDSEPIDMEAVKAVVKKAGYETD
jgi:copper ion binding protein